MARTVKNAKIDTRTARTSLSKRKAPYWTSLAAGCALGYRKGAKGGSWVARYYDAETRDQFTDAIGAADDALDADGSAILNFSQAQAKAREFFKRKQKELSGDYVGDDGSFTVAKALDDYFKDRIRRGSKAVEKDISKSRVAILPELGTVEARKLTTRRIREWHDKLSTAGRTVRAGAGGAMKKQPPIKSDDPEVIRARRSSANRTLTILKAALNHAFHEGLLVDDTAWRKVKPHRGVDAPVIRYLTASEAKRLVNACNPDFRQLVNAALVTGCRYGELIRMRAGDYDQAARTITVRESKSGKPRHVALAADGLVLFDKITVDKAPADLIFMRADGNAWGPSHQQRPLEWASKRAKVEPEATFHILRHTYASSLAMRGVPMGVIAAQLGHADTRMTEKHYAHLSPNYVADTVWQALPATVTPSESLKQFKLK